MQYILVKGDVIDVNPYAIQLFHTVKCIWFKGQILCIYDCICTASCGYYPRVATVKAAAIN